MRVTFLGAAREVTSSCYLVETADVRFLADCGAFQSGHEDQERNCAPFVRSGDVKVLGFAHQERLAARMARAHQCTPALFYSALEEACPRNATPAECDEARAIWRLAEASAWTDAALALVRLKLPSWRVRRLQHDGDAWHCALSQHRDLPDWLDDAKEAHHADLALAILLTLVEACRVAAPNASLPGDKEGGASIAVCCENFS